MALRGVELSDPSNAGVSTPSAKGTSSQARGSRAAEKSDNSSEDDKKDTHRRGVKQVIADFEMVGEAYREGFIHYHAGEIAEHVEQMAIGPDASGYGLSDDEGEAYRQDFIHYHVGNLAEHMEQMAIGPEASDCGLVIMRTKDRTGQTARQCAIAQRARTIRYSSTASTVVLMNAAVASAALSPAAATAVAEARQHWVLQQRQQRQE